MIIFHKKKPKRVAIAVLVAVVLFAGVAVFRRSSALRLHVNLGLFEISFWDASNSTNAGERSNLKDVLFRFLGRRHFIVERCKQDYRQDFKNLNKQKRPWVSYSPKRTNNGPSFQILFCPIYKAASSSWLAAFAFLSGALTDLTAFKLKKGRTTLKQLAKDFRMFTTNYDTQVEATDGFKQIRMVVVRHPFERILSAYRDKLEKVPGREYYYEIYGRHIVEMFRNKSDALEQSEATAPTFEEFCQYLSTTSAENWRSRINEHWSPQFMDCPPCSSKFDVIIKVETMGNDKEVLLNLLALGNCTLTRQIHKVFDSWAHVNHDIKKQYFQQLSLPLMQSLYSLYEKDFTYFNYSADDYFRLAKAS